MKKLGPLFLFLFCFMPAVYGQQLPLGTEQQLENLSDVTEEETEDDTYVQQLHYFTAHPLNINAATREELQVLRLLTPLQIESFIRYRALFKNLISLYELQAVPQWDLTTIRNLLPYISLGAKTNPISARLSGGDHSVMIRNSRLLQKQKGFNRTLPTHFTGDRNHILFRYKYQYKNELLYGIVGDKDAGESFFKTPQRTGFDFYSAHLFVRKLGIIKALAIGDFTVNMGQGLVQWQALAFKKSSEPMAIIRQSATLMPYRSAGEALFNRGAGITMQEGAWEATVFGSLRRISANTVSDSGYSHFTSISTSGLHRTASELRDKNAIKQTSFGGTLKLRKDRFSIGLNAVRYHFSQPLQKRDEPYNHYAIQGQDWHNMSMDYTLVYKNVYVFGEAAVDKRGSTAFVNGAIASVNPNVDVSIIQRHIAPAYQSLYGNAFTENVMPSNEQGLYLGLTMRPVPVLRIAGYADFFKFPWLKYRVDAPSAGQDYLLQLTYKPGKTLEAYARYRQEEKALNEINADSITRSIAPKRRQNIRLHTTYKVTRKITIKGRAELILYDIKGASAEKGFLVYVETGYGDLKKLKTNFRLQYFTTGDYNSRIYAYESDVLYSYSIPAFFNDGFRYYFNLQYDVFKKLSVWLRWSQTRYQNQQTIGSGLTSIMGNTISEVKCQASYRF